MFQKSLFAQNNLPNVLEKPAVKSKNYILSLIKARKHTTVTEVTFIVFDSIIVVDKIDNQISSNNILNINAVNYETFPDVVDKVSQFKNIVRDPQELAQPAGFVGKLLKMDKEVM